MAAFLCPAKGMLDAAAGQDAEMFKVKAISSPVL